MSHVPVIAIIDDDEAIRTGISSLLRSEGYDIRLFENADAFLAASSVAKVDLVVTDIQMDGMNGLELQDILKVRQPGLPLLVMTAFPQPDLRRKAMSQGAQCFICKPFKAEELLACIRRALAG